MKSVCEQLECEHDIGTMKLKNNKFYCTSYCPTYPSSFLCCYSCKRKKCDVRTVQYHKISTVELQKLLIFERFEQAP